VKEKAERGTLQNQIIKLLQQRKDDLEMVTEVLQKHQKNTQESFERIKVDH
jgi:chaperonin cofactor prefoldin